ncbi:MAG: response regulator [Thermodesulfobacteriota bacterium]
MSQQNDTDATAAASYRFLIVDDSLFARKNISKVVESIGGTVAGEAANGKEAIEKYFELKPDLVLMDVSMPEMEGLEALKIIKDRDPDANVVMVSSLGYEDLVKKAISLGAKHYIPKPLKSESAALIIKFVLEGGGEESET